jgi:MFS family permease
MAGCDANNLGGDSSAGFGRVLNWTILGAAIGTFAVALNLSGPLGWVGFFALLAGLAAGAGVGLFVGSAIDWFGRLKEQSPKTITMCGVWTCAGRNPFGLQPWTDGDWTTNLGSLTLCSPADLPVTAPGAITQVDEVRTRAAPGSDLAVAFKSFQEDGCHDDNSKCITDILHCEISAHQGSYSVVGGAVGSVAGTAIGIVAGILACIALGIFTFGIGAALCLLLVAILAAVGAWAGGAVGDAVGAFVGWVVDELSDFDKLGKTIEANQNCVLFLTGTWVTDISHQHNEIHDIEAVQIGKCQQQGPLKQPLTNVGVVAIGRQPHGDPPR